MKITDRIMEGIRNNDYELFNIGLQELEQYLKDKNFYEKIRYINNLNLNEEERFIFSTKASLLPEDVLSLTFSKEVIPEAFNMYITENKDKIYSLLLTNREIQKQYASWFKTHPYVIDNHIDLYSILFNTESFRDIILDDEAFISQYFNRDYKFFALIPNDYAYLISLFDTNKVEELIDLYNNKFKDRLEEVDQLELIKIQITINNEPNMFELNSKDKKYEFTYCLKKINNDSTYYQFLKDIATKTNLDLKIIIKLASKYDNTNLLKDINNSLSIDSDTIDKIKFLSISNIINNISSIKDLENISIDKLKGLEKDNNRDIKINIVGGPHSKTNNNFFNNNNYSSREIISINQEGSIKMQTISLYGNHEDGVKQIYNDIGFPKDCTTAVERAIYASKKILSITLIIEKEMCIAVIPDNITEEQITNICNLLDDANANSIMGIIVCSNKKDTEYLAFNGESVSIEDAKNYILDMSRKKHSL